MAGGNGQHRPQTPAGSAGTGEGATGGGRRVSREGVIELLLRGHSLTEMVEATGLPVRAIVDPFVGQSGVAGQLRGSNSAAAPGAEPPVLATNASGTQDLADLRRVLGEFRGIRLEHIKMDALDRLRRIATCLSEEFPNGMTGDEVRLIEAERRACVSILRLAAFPRASDSRADELGPRVPAGPGRPQSSSPSATPSGSSPGSGEDELANVATMLARVPLGAALMHSALRQPPRAPGPQREGVAGEAQPEKSAGAGNDAHAEANRDARVHANTQVRGGQDAAKSAATNREHARGFSPRQPADAPTETRRQAEPPRRPNAERNESASERGSGSPAKRRRRSRIVLSSGASMLASLGDALGREESGHPP